MIPTALIGEALQRSDDVVRCQFLGEGLFLLLMIDWETPQKMNSYAVMKAVDPTWYSIEFAPRNLTEEENWEETESDDGHRDLYLI